MGLKSRSALRASSAPVVEALECRVLLSSFMVSNTQDSGPGSLRDDIQMSNAAGGANTITFSPGLTGTITLTSGQLEISANLTISGPGAGSLIVSANFTSRVMQVDQAATVSINDVTITEGQAANGTAGANATARTPAQDGARGGDGGGIYNLGSLTLADDTISSNVAGAGGNGGNGQLGALSSGVGNGGSGGNGGGVYNAGSLSVAGCTFLGDRAGAGGNGGGVYSGHGGNSGSGGAIYTTGGLEISNSSFDQNLAADGGSGGSGGGTTSGGDGGAGGAIAVEAASTFPVVITSSTLSNNVAGNGGNLGGSFGPAGKGGSGGAITSSGRLTLVNCTISGNSAGNGLVSSNTPSAGGNGGGIDNGGTLRLTNVTISGNHAGGQGTNGEAIYSNHGVGGGLNTTGEVILDNTIIARNSIAQNYSGFNGAQLAGIDVGGAVDPVSAYNVVGDGLGMSGLSTSNHNTIGTAGSPAAILAPLGNYGGPTLTMAPLGVSPGSGSVALAVGPDGKPLLTDQRGLPRIVNGMVDIGAYQVQAQPVVNTTTDDASMASGKLSLREALTLVNLDGGPEYGPTTSITFDPTVFANGVANTITLTQGQLELSRPFGPVAMKGPGAAALTITAANASRVFQVDAGVTASISGLTISNGSSDHGGAILSAGTLALDVCMIDLNSVATDGGGIYNTKKLTVSNCTFSSDSAGNAGGAIFDSSGSTLTVSGSTFSNNAAGGGSSALPVPLAGGAIGNAGVLTITESTFSGNTASGTSEGGAIGNGGSLTALNVTITGNTAAGQGGGGIANSGSLTAANVTIAGNSAGEKAGGGILNSGNLMAVNVTIAHNSAGEQAGGGIANTGSALLNNTIVAANQGGDAAGSLTGSYDLIGDGSGGLSVSNHNLLGTSAFPLDAKLAPLADNGGPTQTIALLPGSPAIDAGGNSLAVDASGQALLTDQRGQPRITDGTVDIGAYETPGSFVVNTNLDAATLAAGLVSLRQFLAWADTAAGPPLLTFAANVRGTIALDADLGPLPIITVPITINGPGSGLLRVFANNAAGQFSSIFAVGAGVNATIDGLEIAGGGTGIANAGNLTLSGDLIHGNGDGGGISNAGTVALTNCKLSNNIGPGIAGGAATLSNCTVSGNAGPAISGAGATLVDCTLTGNASGVSVTGGGTLSDCTVSNNTGDGIDSTGTLVVTDSTVSANGSRGIVNSGSATLSGCTISGNLGPADGGGILNNATGTLTLTNCTISGNQAHGANGGGGIENFGTLTLVNSTVSDNTSYQGSGGGMLLAGGVTSLYNTIVALNHNLARPDIAGNLDYNYATKQTQYTRSVPSSNNLISDGSGNLPFGTDGNPTNGNLLGDSITLLDPRLAPLGNYGGPTQTMALRTGSPAIDSGSNALAVGPDGKPLLTDQRGYYRIFNGTVDIGAYEFGSSALLPGDADADGKVNFADLVLVARNYGKTNATWADGDFNNDGSVGFDDLLIVARNYGKSASLAAAAAAMFSASLVGTPSSVATSPQDQALDLRSARL